MELGEIHKSIGPYMKKNGFKRKGKFYFKIKNDIAFCLEFEKPSQIIYIAYYFIPLYIPHENRCFTYGNRVYLESVLTCEYRDQKKNCSNKVNLYNSLLHYIEITIIPFFDKFSDLSSLIEFTKNDKSNNCTICTSVDSVKLLLFSYSFTGQYNLALDAAKKYRILVHNANWLTNTVKENMLKEVDYITYLIQEKTESLTAWHNQVIADSLKACSLL